MTDALRDVIHASIGAFGVVLAAIHVSHLLSMQEPLVRLVEAVIPLLLAVTIVASVGWLRRRHFDRHESIRVAAWICVGVAGMIVAMTWTLGHDLLSPQATHEINHLEFLVANNVTGGAVIGVVLGSYDVRSRRRERAYQTIQRGVERERDRFATLFDNVPNPTVHYEYVDGDPIVQSVNPAFTAVFGFGGGAAVGRSVDELIVPETHREEAQDLNDRLSAEDLQVEVTRETREGPRDFLLYTVPLSNGSGQGFATYVDISDQKRREQRLQVLNRVLRHDLRNAMNVIIGHANNLIDGANRKSGAADADFRSADVAECAGAIRDRSEELLARSQKARAVERVLDLDPTRRRDVDVARVVEQHLAVAEDAYPGFTVSLDRPTGPAWASANDLIGIAIDNLLENVARHIEDPTVHVTVEPGDPVTITIRDDGPGIPEAEIAVLNGGRETQLEHSSGLGLWLVTWIVRDTNGSITFRNRPDGAEVRIELPAAEPAASDRNDDEDDRGEGD